MPTFEDFPEYDEEDPSDLAEVDLAAGAAPAVAGPTRPSKKPSGKDLVAGVPIAGFVGVNGAGKTMLAAQSAIHDMALGRDVYSTLPITSPWGDTKPIVSLRQLLHLEDATLLFDEVSVIFSSRSSQSLPAEVVALLQTLRHRRLTVRWTAPAWMRCDNLLREVTQGVVNVMPLLRYNEKANPWPRPRLMLATLLDTSVGKTDAMPEKRLGWRLYRPRALDAFGAYDTHADTPLLGRHLQGGNCVDCGGSQERPKHTEARHAMLGLPWYPEDVRAPQRAL
jgi:hypothetical protein